MRIARTVVFGGFIALATVAAYWDSFRGAFVYLDGPAIVDNPTIRRLGDLRRVLAPPTTGGVTVGGRPMVNLSLAVNYALGGTHIWGYHAFNLAVHVAAALLLFGIIRRTAVLLGGTESECDRFSFVAVLVWAVHPLLTESVTYIVQRAESLMGMFYLATLYGFIRFAVGEERRAGGWAWVSVLACLAGMATKEVMVSAPVMVLLYDRTFVSGSLAEAWRRRRGYYGALALTWVPLFWLVASGGADRGGTAGFNLGFSWWGYVQTQFPAVLRYLKLAVWPHPLDFYYTPWPAMNAGVEIFCFLALALGAAAVALAFWRGGARGAPVGYLGVFFFAILSPTSLVPGMSQTMAEHRMYLALAPVVALLAWGLRSACGRFVPGKREQVFLACGLAWAAGLASLTARRNLVYQSELSLWRDTALKSPTNPFALNNLGTELAGAGRPGDAIAPFERALALRPEYPDAENNLGLALANAGRPAEALAHYAKALALKRGYAEAETNLGVALASLGRMTEAIGRFQAAVRDDSRYSPARADLAAALAHSGRLSEAVAQYRQALALDPANAECRFDFANALAQAGQWNEAEAEYRQALRLGLNSADLHANLGVALATLGRQAEAVGEYNLALARTPSDADIRYDLGLALRSLGREKEAQEQFAESERLRSVTKGSQP